MPNEACCGQQRLLDAYRARVEMIGDVEIRREDGGLEPPPNIGGHTFSVRVKGMDVPVLSLEYEHEAYLRLDRAERELMVREKLEKSVF